jgi:DNA-binding transcriptional LysR family regulator
MTPAISSHCQLVRALFEKHRVAPSKFVEADQEFVIADLVASGVGVSLVREELALEKVAAGEVCLWGELRVETDLWFIYRAGRDTDPVIRALLDVLAATWQTGARAQPASELSA